MPHCTYRSRNEREFCQNTEVLLHCSIMSAIHKLPPGPDVPKRINVLVEIPKGSQNKYEYDHELHVVKLDRVLYSPLYYPGDYGFIPGTLGHDGDPLDALALVTFPTYPGTLIESRPIGMLEMIDSGENDAKILCVPANDIRYADTHDITDVPEPVRTAIAHFFQVYKELEGKHVQVVGWNDAAHAERAILDAIMRATDAAA